MKHKISYLSLILFLLLSKITFSQVTVTVENMNYLNGTTISNCGVIDFEDNSSVSIQMFVKMKKPINLAMGNSNLIIYTKKTTSTYEVSRYSQIVQTVNWSESNGEHIFYATIPITLSAIEFNVTGGFLYASLEYSNGLSSESCNYPIVKDEVPTFTLSPSGTVYMACGSTNPVNFTVDNVYDSQGSLEYHWSIGTGWLDENGNSTPATFTTTSDNITLTPIATPPGNVNVVPELDNTSYPELTAIFGLAPYNPTNLISGNSSLCSTATYSVNNLPSGVSVTSWSVSDNTIATITTNGNQATLTATGNGTVSITANLINACGQTKPIVKNNIYVGAPDFSPYPAMSGDNNPMVGEYKWYSVTGAEGATSYNWYFDVGNGVTGTNIDGWEILNYGYQNKSIYVKIGNPGTTVVVCKATNACDTRTKYKYVNVRSPNDPCGDFRLSSNPMKSGSSTNKIIYPPIDPCDNDPFGKTATNSKKIKTVEIFNSYGEPVYSKSQTENEFNLSELKKGFYFVKGQITNGKTITKKLIIE
ncbi:T9SS type A sorting domain-containing protein [Xanthomarina sp. F1114]|uniref:T9SS type A sorting domain-containing protein n=1 Tax=Xanthomarina sp. F1114 TaxID=2996019 RepID=UPI00225E165A|nr:T9SS type A sorting domain-containing protein [Xanthomarina sp. F1114]MCX7546368.1 T9SS type A sorting domain-containing protein [Xanthomarina sp. F1114]